MNCFPKKSRTPNGFSLVELLIVIAIMMVLTGIAIPAIRSLTRGDAVREAARSINLFIDSARADAIADGFGGIWIERDDDSNQATRLYKIQRPQRYTGDFADTRALIEHGSDFLTCGATGNLTFNALFFADENSLFEPDPNGVRGIKVNDRIQFDHKGPWFIIQEICGDLTNHPINHPRDPSRKAYVCELALSASDYSRDSMTAFDALNAYPKPAAERQVSFRIERAPVISTRDVLQLPKGTFLNLTDSGFRVDDLSVNDDQRGGGAEFADPVGTKKGPVVIAFRQDGSVDRVDYELNLAGHLTRKSQYPPSSIFLHVSSESETLAPKPQRLHDLDNLWVTISRSNGTVMTGHSVSIAGSVNDAESRAQSRRAARDGQNQTAN